MSSIIYGEELEAPGRLIVDIADSIEPVNIMDVCQYISACDQQNAMRIVDSLLIKFRSLDSLMGVAESRAFGMKLTSGNMEYNKFALSAIPASTVKPDADAQEIWFGIYPQSMTYVIGGSGVGKTSIAYAIGLHGALGKDLWGIPWARGPEKILYLDPENVGVPRARRLENISQYDQVSISPNLVFHDCNDINLSDPGDIRQLGDYISAEGFTGLIIEPYLNVFETNSENDNAEAMQQLKPFLKMMQRTNIWTMVFHHSGSGGEVSQKMSGRGATARHGAAYVAMTIETPTPPGTGKGDDDYAPGVTKYREDSIRIKVNKNRPGGQYYALYLRMRGNDGPDTFDRITPKEYWQSAENPDSAPTSEQKARAMVLEVMVALSPDDNQTPVPARVVMDEVRKIKGAPGDGSIRKAIGTLTEGEGAPLAMYSMRLPGGPKAIYWSSLDPSELKCPGTGELVSTSGGLSEAEFTIGEE
jgi:hypothetical protein